MTVDELLSNDQFGMNAAQKRAAMLPLLLQLTARHRDACEPYGRILESQGWDSARCGGVDRVPFLPVGVFKRLALTSVSPEDVFATIQSSGTSDQAPSRIVLDRRTAQLQSRALASILSHVLPSRLPLLMLDREEELRSVSARGVGIRGLLPFGRGHAFAFDRDMNPNRKALDRFLQTAAGGPFAMFGFTYLTWMFLSALDREVDFRQGTLIHSGGWKKLAASGVSNEEFKSAWHRRTGLRRIFNFYGMAEQVGSVFLEGEDGYLYTPACADVIVRNPETWEPAPFGEAGVVQVLSVLPHSYPGHSILTEDVGVIDGEDDGPCGRRGKYFRILGRLDRAELRGCSDVAAAVA